MQFNILATVALWGFALTSESFANWGDENEYGEEYPFERSHAWEYKEEGDAVKDLEHVEGLGLTRENEEE